MGIWIGGQPIRDPGFRYVDPESGSFLELRLRDDAHWNIRARLFDQQGKNFIITEVIDPRKPFVIMQDGAFVRLTPFTRRENQHSETQLGGTADLLLEICSFDEDGESVFNISPDRMRIIKGQRIHAFGVNEKYHTGRG